MAFSLQPLPYAQDALQPVISAETLALHHGKHLQAYVNNLNEAIPGTPFEMLSLEDIVLKSEGGILNNAGQILNHNLYFAQFRAPKQGPNLPTGKLLTAIEQAFGSFPAFQDQFVQKGTTLFGSGWVWLSADKEGKLHITQETNAYNPIQKGLCPLLTFDVWEHAYYVDYQNRRKDHLTALWPLIDWDIIAHRFILE
jgi:Superoxide dismutase